MYRVPTFAEQLVELASTGFLLLNDRPWLRCRLRGFCGAAGGSELGDGFGGGLVGAGEAAQFTGAVAATDCGHDEHEYGTWHTRCHFDYRQVALIGFNCGAYFVAIVFRQAVDCILPLLIKLQILALAARCFGCCVFHNYFFSANIVHRAPRFHPIMSRSALFCAKKQAVDSMKNRPPLSIGSLF